jgi:hypothetical protein
LARAPAADVEKVAGEIVARHGRIDPAYARTTTEWC